MSEDTKGDASAIIDAVESLSEHEFVDVGGQSVLIVPSGKSVKSIKPFLDEYRTAPERKKGVAEMLDLDSFIAHTNRFSDAESAVFADSTPGAPSIQTVFDYNESKLGAPRFGEHRTSYRFPLSDEWKAWIDASKKWVSQKDFAEFLETRIVDVLPAEDAGPLALRLLPIVGSFAEASSVMAAARGLKVRVNRVVHNAVNTSSGESQFVFVEEHRGEDNAPLNVPQGMLVGIPVFRGDDPYTVAVRIRYRITDGVATWNVEPMRLDLVLDDAFKTAVDRVRKETDLPVFVGKPLGRSSALETKAPRGRAAALSPTQENQDEHEPNRRARRTMNGLSSLFHGADDRARILALLDVPRGAGEIAYESRIPIARVTTALQTLKKSGRVEKVSGVKTNVKWGRR